ncbi:hypothetical protein RUM44_006667 [Polyplax serrata]|uniref:AB hydrolase-1 domain-containing protein n=1 Tax=Polyplax serrata TaxID=468196 RepID=A0ABR1AIR1_POLSC
MLLSRIGYPANKLFPALRHARYFMAKPSALAEDQAEEIKIPVPWGHIAGKWWGDKNQIPVVALHGWQDNAGTFDRLIPLLNLSSVLAIDMPGHGHSSHLPAGKIYHVEDLIILLQRIIEDQKWGSVPLLTHSFGGNLGFAYASIFPEKVKYFISFDCARTLVTLYTYNTHATYSEAVESFLKVEKQKLKQSSPSYKLSEMIKMTVDGSLGSVCSAESALVLLKRGAKLADNQSPVSSSSRASVVSDLETLMTFERQAAEHFSKEEKEKLLKYHQRILQVAVKSKENIKNFTLDSEQDKYYTYTRDPGIRIQSFLGFNQDLLIEASKNIKCPVLSIRATDGFLYGSTKKLYELTNDNVKASCSYFEHHDVAGTHHSHLNTPENVAPIINNFLEKIS